MREARRHPGEREVSEVASSDGKREARAETLMAEAVRIIDAGRDVGVALRLTGGLAIRRHCTDLAFLTRDYSDIDMVGLAAQAVAARDLFERLGYAEDYHVTQATGGCQRQFVPLGRLLESHAHVLKRARLADEAVRSRLATGHVDVFFDVMRMDHDVVIRERIALDDYAISPADALLTKLQIGKLTGKDVHDIVALVKDVPLGCDDTPGRINTAHIADECCRDWGMYFDIMNNLDLIIERLDDWNLQPVDERRVRAALATIQGAISAEEKTFRWRLRARLGRRLPWRREVEETGSEPDVDGSALRSPYVSGPPAGASSTRLHSS